MSVRVVAGPLLPSELIVELGPIIDTTSIDTTSIIHAESVRTDSWAARKRPVGVIQVSTSILLLLKL